MSFMMLELGSALVLAVAQQACGAGTDARLAIAFPEAGGRRVFRNIECPVIEACLPPEAARGIRGRISDGGGLERDFELAAEPDGKFRAKLNLTGLAPGEYVVRVSNGGAATQTSIHIVERPAGKGFFPIVCQFSPVPSGAGWRGDEKELTPEVLKATVNNILSHGFTGIEWDVPLPAEQADIVRNYAQAKGMVITHHVGTWNSSAAMIRRPSPCTRTNTPGPFARTPPGNSRSARISRGCITCFPTRTNRLPAAPNRSAIPNMTRRSFRSPTVTRCRRTSKAHARIRRSGWTCSTFVRPSSRMPGGRFTAPSRTSIPASPSCSRTTATTLSVPGSVRTPRSPLTTFSTGAPISRTCLSTTSIPIGTSTSVSASLPD